MPHLGSVSSNTAENDRTAIARPSSCPTADSRKAGGLSIAPELTLLAVFAYYLAAWVDVRLIFWNQNDLFLGTCRFVRPFLIWPGQPCHWAGKLLLQPCSLGWPGMLVLTCLAGTLVFAARAYYLRLKPGETARYACGVPAILLAVILGQYTVDLSAILGLAVAIVGSGLYSILPGHRHGLRLLVFVGASLLIDYAAGNAYYVFAACCVILEFSFASRRRLGVALLLVVPLVVFGVERSLWQLNVAFVHAEMPEVRYRIGPGAAEAGLLTALYVSFPACALFLAMQDRFVARFAKLRSTATSPVGPASQDCGDDGTTDGTPNHRPHAAKGGVSGRILRWAVAPALVAIAAAGVRWSGAACTRAILAIDCHANDRNWDAVLEAAERLPSGIRAEDVSGDINLALYHTGRLPYDMFRYPQSQVMADQDSGNRGRLQAREAFDLLLALGRVNEAETVAHDDQEHHPSAEAMRRIVLVKRIKGQTGAARVYLNVLRDEVCYGHWAVEQLARLDENAEPPEPEIAEARRRMIVADDAYRTHGETESRIVSISRVNQLVSLLDRDPTNRMAFEYLMASHMMAKDLDAAVALLPRAREFFGGRLPPLYEEAAMLYAGRHRDRLVASADGTTVCGCPIGSATLKRFQRLLAIDQTCRGLNNPASREAVRHELGSTYFLYYFFGLRGS